MDKDFVFTCILSEYNKKTLDSIIKQIGFEDNIQMILAFEDETLKQKYPSNVTVTQNIKNSDIMGKYFIYIDTVMPHGLFSDVKKIIREYGECELIEIACDKSGKINIDNDFRHSLLDIHRTFIRTDLIENIDSYDNTILNRLFLDLKICTALDYELENHLYDFSARLDLYRNLIGYCDGKPSKYLQYAIIDDMYDYMLTKQHYDIRDVLGYIDNMIIRKHKSLDSVSKKYLLYAKNDEFHHEIKGNQLFLKSDNIVLNGLHDHKISLDIVELRNGFLNISGSFVSYCYTECLDFEVVVKTPSGDKKIYTAEKFAYPTTERQTVTYFSVDWKFHPSFDFKIPYDSKSNFTVYFRIRFHENGDEKLIYPKLAFVLACNLSNFNNFFTKDSKIVLYRDNAIHLVDDSFLFKTKLHLKAMSKILKSGEDFKYYSIYLRLLYFMISPFWKNRRIWLFADRPDVADDNAKHLFRYAVEQNDGIRKYYLLDKNSDDFKVMKRISKNIVAFGSLKHKLLFLYAEKYISSHSGNAHTIPYFNINYKLYSGLATTERVFLQHGITIHEVSYWLRKYFHNFVLFVTASDLERKSIITPNYNYTENEVKTLGFPRYDNLSNDELKKQILFMPTWRKNLIENEEDLLDSQYFKNINEFLNSPELKELLEKHGFRVMFKPHYKFLKFAHLFSIPDYITLSIDETYQELFNKSMILITDYSSVFFDFAYLKKPVIYYHGDDEEFHYPQGYFDYETMGFGELTTSLDELIEIIRRHLEKGCAMDEKYIKRVDSFFKYTDKNNCKRVYEWLYEHE